MEQHYTTDNTIDNTTAQELRKFRRNGGLIRRKLIEYIPVMILTNLLLLLISTVNGLIAGNFLGEDAFSSINIFYPVSVLLAAFGAVTAVGIATSISTAMGRNNLAELARVKGASLYTMLGMAVFMGIVQIPIVSLIISSYHLPPEMHSLTWQYAIGIMLCQPFSLISTVGTYQLQVSGKMKVLMMLTIAESLSNLAFDLLFVAVLHMGVAGTGYGTLCANIVRCTATVIYIRHKTDFYSIGNYKPCLKDIREILACGIPDASFTLVSAFQSYFMLRILISSFGLDGPVINGVIAFCASIASVMIPGIHAGVRPLMGLLVGAEDRIGIKELMKQGAVANVLILGITTAAMEFFPALFYHVNGIKNIPDGGLLSVRLYAAFFVIHGLNYLLRLYLSNRRDIKTATALTISSNALLPLFALIISRMMPAPFIYLSYTVTGLLLLIFSYRRYCWWLAEDKKQNRDLAVIYMTIEPDEAVETSRLIRKFADEHGVDKSAAYRVALCLEEMAAYVKSTRNLAFAPDGKPDVEIMVRFKDRNSAVFVSLDEGDCISLDKDDEKQRLITNNYDLIKKIAKEVEYQYILNLNYTRITIQTNPVS